MGNSESRKSNHHSPELLESSIVPDCDPHTLQRCVTAPTKPTTGQSQLDSNLSSCRAPLKRQQSYELGGIEHGQQATEDTTSKLGYWYLMKNGYNELVHLIIRPPRATYQLQDLGPTEFNFLNRPFERIDFAVKNERQFQLECSFWRNKQTEQTPVPCIIYLHGNSSCRMECLSVLSTCLSSGMNVVAFDCSGSGMSQGSYISLGYYERDDVQAVIAHLRDNNWVSTIGIWGRSMGAATALLHVDRDPSIAGIIVDSCFTSLDQLVQEIVQCGKKEGIPIPIWGYKLIMRCIRSSVLKRAQFDLKDIVPMSHVPVSHVPAMFVAGRDDSFIGVHHTQELHAAYAGDKRILIVNGDHNSQRPNFMLDSAGIFLRNALQIEESESLVLVDRILGSNRRLPWKRKSKSARIPWQCRVCTFRNIAERRRCEMCQSAKREEPSEVIL